MNHTALVTGASSGSGRGLAEIHARHKGDVILVAQRGERLKAPCDELQSEHGIDS